MDHLGTLLRVDREIAKLLEETEEADGPLLAYAAKKHRAKLEARIAEFLDAHAAEADLGLRLEGEQLAAGLRFVRMVNEGTYDVVVGNPPYQGLSKTAAFDYVARQYPRGKADLYAAFLERGLELVKEGGVSGLVTMRGWMFLAQFADLRMNVLKTTRFKALGDLATGAFSSRYMDSVISTALAIVTRLPPDGVAAAIQAGVATDPRFDAGKPLRREAALLAQVGRHEFDPKGFQVIEGEPIVYWWSPEFLSRYADAPKLAETYQSRKGAWTSDNIRFLRHPHEVVDSGFHLRSLSASDALNARWLPYVGGAKGQIWIDSLTDVINWRAFGLELKVLLDLKHGVYPQGTDFFFRRGVAFSQIGATCSARVHRYPGAFGDKGSSVFPPASLLGQVLCMMNRELARGILESLNPSISFQLGDVGRLPLFSVEMADNILATIERSFSEHESHREPSVEFKAPGPSLWRYAQDWAQRAVDRPEGAPLPPYEPEYDPPDPEARVSFAIGVALGRFGGNGEGILDQAPTDALPAGILFVSASEHLPDSLRHPAAQRIQAAWDEHSAAILKDKRLSLREWLKKDFFTTYHKGLYENRPIYFPLSSEKRSFVAYVSIHRWTDNTLQALLADHLNPTLVQLDGEISDLNRARASSDKKTSTGAEKQYAVTKKLRDELADFIAAVTQCAERGAPPVDGCKPREVDAPFRMDLDDGVMINSAALWPLLAPQ